jgi:hypothetical protein
MGSGRRVDKLPRNPHAAACLSNTAFEDIAHPKLSPHLLHVYGLALVSEARIAGDDEQCLETGQCGDDLLNHPISKILLLGITAHILEGQDCY